MSEVLDRYMLGFIRFEKSSRNSVVSFPFLHEETVMTAMESAVRQQP